MYKYFLWKNMILPLAIKGDSLKDIDVNINLVIHLKARFLNVSNCIYFSKAPLNVPWFFAQQGWVAGHKV